MKFFTVVSIQDQFGSKFNDRYPSLPQTFTLRAKRLTFDA